MFVTILSKLEFGSDDKIPSGSSVFTDLSQDWYKNAVAWAFQNKIAYGISSLEFNPDGTLIREQIVAFIYRYAGYKGHDISYDIGILNKYSDNDKISDYAKPAMAWALKHGLIAGVSETLLEPQAKVSRAQSADIFIKFFNLINEKPQA